MNETVAKRFDQLVRDIELHSLQLRRFADILLVEGDFLRFYEIFGTLERTLLELTDAIDDEGPLPTAALQGLVRLLDQQVYGLRQSRAVCLRRLDGFSRRVLQRLSPDEAVKSFAERLETNLKRLQQSHEQFRTDVQRTVWLLGDIQLIAEAESLVAHADQLAEVVCRNHVNCLRVLRPSAGDRLPGTLVRSFRRLRFTVDSLLVVVLVRFWALLDTLDTMDEDGAESIRVLHEQLRLEIRQSLDEMQVNEEEPESLRQKLFPSAVSLATERTVAVDRRELQAGVLLEQLRDIDELEGNREELEGRVAQLVAQREAIQGQLEDRRRLLNDGVREIVRLERLIEVTEQKIAAGKDEFRQQTADLEQRRRELLQDEGLSSASRLALLAECDAQLKERSQTHASNMQLLEVKRDEFIRVSAGLADDVETFRDELEKRHQDKLAELEQRKQYASPSELEQIEADIARQQAEHEENLSMLNRARSRSEQSSVGGSQADPEAHVPRHGSIDSSQQHPTAARTGEKVTSATEIMQEGQTESSGLDGKQATSSSYIDDTGPRMDAGLSDGAEPVGSQSEPAEQGQADEPVDDAVSETEEDRERRRRVASGVAYIERTVGVPLRRALAVVARVQPADPVGYLADFLALLGKTPLDDDRRLQLLERLCTADKKSQPSSP